VGVNVVTDVNAADVVLYSEFTDLEALKTYQAHPLHQAVVPKVKALTTERRSVDYEV
jgi:quinol monooxygenase YgiN